MELLIEPIRWTTSLFALATAAVMLRAVRSSSSAPAPILRVVPVWLAIATGVGMALTHLLPTLPAVGLLPAGSAVGLGLGIATLFSPGVEARFAALDDLQWRLLTLTRAVFGGLLLAGGAANLLPVPFALSAGLGDILVATLAFIVPGSIAAHGHRGYRLLVFGVGIADFVAVFIGIVTLLVPWLAQTRSPGLSLMLPWVAVPMIATLNLFGLRLLLREPAHVPATSP
jgi:hypothetical protein